MVLVENEELALFSWKEMVWDVLSVLHVCKDVEKIVSYKKEEVVAQLMNMTREWELRGVRPPKLGWCQRDPRSEAPGADSGGCREN
jgi:hypothetical protein